MQGIFCKFGLDSFRSYQNSLRTQLYSQRSFLTLGAQQAVDRARRSLLQSVCYWVDKLRTSGQIVEYSSREAIMGGLT
jgi:hypothetical protein